MGVFVANTINWNEPALVLPAEENRNRFLDNIRSSVDVARRLPRGT